MTDLETLLLEDAKAEAKRFNEDWQGKEFKGQRVNIPLFTRYGVEGTLLYDVAQRRCTKFSTWFVKNGAEYTHADIFGHNKVSCYADDDGLEERTYDL